MIESIYTTLHGFGFSHPLHPVFTHLPVGLVIATVIFAMISWILKRPALAQTARHCSILALIAVPVAAAVGIMDWRQFYGGAFFFPIVLKMVMAALLAAGLVTAVATSYKKDIQVRRLLPLYGFCLLLVAGLGYFGGELVYGPRSADSPTVEEKPLSKQAPGVGEATIAEKAPVPESPDPARVQAGAVAFRRMCVFCHLTDTTETKVGPGLKGLYGMATMPVSGWVTTDENVRKQLRIPFKNMPAFPDMTGEEENSIVAYLKTL